MPGAILTIESSCLHTCFNREFLFEVISCNFLIGIFVIYTNEAIVNLSEILMSLNCIMKSDSKYYLLYADIQKGKINKQRLVIASIT